MVDRIIQLKNGQEAYPAEQILQERAHQKKIVQFLSNSLSSAMFSRAELFSYLGKTFSGKRDLYKILGYPRELSFKDFKARYVRQEIAKACINRPVNSSWRKKPIITDDDDPEVESAFEKAVVDLQKTTKFFHYMVRLDKLASLGNYAVLLLGYGDGKLEEEVVKGGKKKLLYLQVYSQENAMIKSLVDDTQNERFGQPLIYGVRIGSTNISSGTSREIPVHFSRILHVASEALESDIFGTPQLEDVYNRLQDLETISGGSAEMYWKGARPGYGLSLKEDYAFDEDDKAALDKELTEFDNELRRYMRLKGFDIKELGGTLTSPKEFIDILIDLIAAGKNIPKRILMGSERGELASSQDESNWNQQMDSRRIDYLEPMIIRPFIDRQIELGVLPEPKGGDYTLDWPEFETPGEETIVKNAKDASEAIAKYADSPGASLVMPPAEFLQRFFKVTKSEAEEMLKKYEEDLLLEDEDIVKDDSMDETGSDENQE